MGSGSSLLLATGTVGDGSVAVAGAWEGSEVVVPSASVQKNREFSPDTLFLS